MCFVCVALKYNLSADITLNRVGLYENGRVTTVNSLVSSTTIAGSGESNAVCGDTVTFALYVSNLCLFVSTCFVSHVHSHLTCGLLLTCRLLL